ncbi:MAG: tyrosine-type recombinase/integrase [Sedimenticola sp.]
MIQTDLFGKTVEDEIPASKPQRSLEQRVTQLIDEGIADNTREAFQRDREYFERWAELRFRRTLTYPVSVETVLQFVVDHSDQMPSEIEAQLIREGYRRKSGPWALSTLRRCLASIATLHQRLNLEDPTKDNRIKLLLRRMSRSRGRKRPRKLAITAEILRALIDTCKPDSLTDCRDRALLLVGFSSGGRRRSELAAMEIRDLSQGAEGYELRLRYSKTDQNGQGMTVAILNEAAYALEAWLDRSGLKNGKLFRSIDRWDNLGKALTGRSVHRIVTRRLRLAGYDPGRFCAHSLRSGFLSESGRQKVALGDSMALSGHKTVATALHYYRSGEVHQNPAACLLGP